MKNAEAPEYIGNAFITKSPQFPELWNPNANVQRVEVTDQGIGVLNFMENIEIFTATPQPVSLGVAERYLSPGQATGRCADYFKEGVPPFNMNLPVPCVEDFNYPPTTVLPPNP